MLSFCGKYKFHLFTDFKIFKMSVRYSGRFQNSPVDRQIVFKNHSYRQKLVFRRPVSEGGASVTHRKRMKTDTSAL